MPTTITYATMSSDNREMNEAYDRAVAANRDRLGQTHGIVIAGEVRHDRTIYDEHSPIDSNLLIGRYAQATRGDIDDAILAAHTGFTEWQGLGWERRRDLMLEAAEIMERDTFDLGALMSYEIGKNRLEALGEVAETVEFFRYYSRQITEHDGFVTPLSSLSDTELNTSVLLPYGVWAVISPFNFPLALSAGPAIGALITGNTVVIKPSNTGALMALEFLRVMTEAGLPREALSVLTGDDGAGDYLAHHPGIDGLTFTGSHTVGMSLYRSVGKELAKPVNAEMGGKNPAIVSDKADLDVATTGVLRGAFGLSGQKCSATSRVYVHESVYDDFVGRLAAATSEVVMGNPLDLSTFVGPVIDEAAVSRFEKAVAEVESSGGEVVVGGRVRSDGVFASGHYVEPTVVTAPRDSWIWTEELFVPLVAVTSVSSLDEAIDLANDTVYGLTAGFFSSDETEIQTWWSRIEAGVTYVNRAAGATTGAWPDIQSFGGWKGSGTSGAGGGGPWYLRQFLREQSRTIVRDPADYQST